MIKRTIIWALNAVAALSMASCEVLSGDYSTATGKPYELIVSLDRSLWDGPVEDTLRAVFSAPLHMYNQQEPMYDVMRVNPSALEGILLRHRNILEVKVMPQVEKPVIQAQYDIYARPQILVTVAAPDTKSLTGYLSDNRAELQHIFEMAERGRSLSAAQRFNERGIENEIMKTFGMKIDIPMGYKLRSKAGDDFLWISNEQALSSQGMIIYSYPFSGRSDLDRDRLWARRNEFTARVPGPSEGSYMTTADFEPDLTYMRINGRSWAEMRGLWDVKGDFMGGPFVNYTTVDMGSGRVVSIDLYVFSPRNPKRNLMHSLEHLIYSVDFPAATAAE